MTALANVTTEAIKSIFDNAYMDCKIDEDGDIYVSSAIDFPLWVSVTEDRSLIRIWSYIVFKDKESVDVDKANKLCNAINAKFILITTYQTDGKLMFGYYLSHNNTIDPKLFINLVRRCATIFKQAILEMDTDDLISTD